MSTPCLRDHATEAFLEDKGTEEIERKVWCKKISFSYSSVYKRTVTEFSSYIDEKFTNKHKLNTLCYLVLFFIHFKKFFHGTINLNFVLSAEMRIRCSLMLLN